MKQILCLAFLATLLVSIPAAHASTDETPSGVIMKMRENSAKVRDMQCLFVKDITKKGTRYPQTSMTFKYLKDPETIYLEFLDRHKGRKCLYVAGENDGKVVVRMPGLMKFMKIKLDPHGKQAMQEDIDPITNMGFGAVVMSVSQWYETALSHPGFKVEFQKEAQVDGGIYYFLKIASDAEKEAYIDLHVDRETCLPYRLSYRIDGNSAVYTYKNLKTNTHLSREDLQL